MVIPSAAVAWARASAFVALLSDAQLRWLRQEAKRRVDARPASTFVQSRYPLYKVEEDELVQEWMDRAAYGESIPTAEDIHGPDQVNSS